MSGIVSTGSLGRAAVNPYGHSRSNESFWNLLHQNTEFNTNINTPPPSAEELELIRINTELGRLQLQNINQLAPFQREMLELSLADMRREAADRRALDAAITPADRAALQREEFDRARRLGPIQEKLVQMQLDAMEGKVSPEQEARIRAATDEAIRAGFGDIDIATGEGIGLIADELANSRGLRLSDSPIMREAGALAEQGTKQKGSLVKSMRANQAGAMLQAPQIASGIGLSQQQIAQNAQQFQAGLRMQAAQNRLALSGQTMSSGIGLASVGSGAGSSALNSLSGVRAQNRNIMGNQFGANANIGGISQGLAAWFGSDRRLKKDIEKVGTLPNGIPVYTYKFLGCEEERVGVMADEVIKVMPEAVRKDKDGYYEVNYGMLKCH